MNIVKSAWQKATNFFTSSRKSGVSISQDGLIRAFGLIDGGTRITPSQAIEFYEMVAPVFTGVDKISKNFANIKPHLFDRQADKFDDKKGKDVLALLNKPNADKTQNEFMRALASYFLITGNQYTVATGDKNRPPLELEIIPSQDVTVTGTNKDYYASQFVVERSGVTFQREELNKRFRYFSRDNSKEIWHIRTFNSGLNTELFLGSSPLRGIFYEIRQHLKASIHNLSLLSRGARPSGIIFAQDEMMSTQRDHVANEVREKWGGEQNAGTIGFMSGSKFDFKELSQKLKDMDFRKLKNDVAVAIYNALDIPLPIISPEHMTMDNYSEARLALYDEAILPLADKLYEELSIFLFPRFKLDIERYILKYNPTEITALETRAQTNITKLRESNVLTIDEIRALYNYEAIDGGDVIYQGINLVPLGTSPIQKNTIEKFSSIMRNYKNSDGSQKYTEERISVLAAKYKLFEEK